MLDGVMRRVIDPPLAAVASNLAKVGVGADAMTGFSLACGLLCAGSIAGGNFGLALLFLALGRIGDGLDGAIARVTTPTDRGGFIDIVGDFVFYGAVPLAFAWFAPQENALAAAWLLFTFYVNGATFLAYAAVAARRRMEANSRGSKTIYFTAGLAEGTETIAAFGLMMILPALFPEIAVVFGVLCLLTAGGRVMLAWKNFR